MPLFYGSAPPRGIGHSPDLCDSVAPATLASTRPWRIACIAAPRTVDTAVIAGVVTVECRRRRGEAAPIFGRSTTSCSAD
jgi:hypothetical protein